MKAKLISALSLFLVSALIMLADANASGIYICKDELGNTEYRNTNITKECKKANLPMLITGDGGSYGSRGSSGGGTAKKRASAPPAKSPSNFPKIGGGEQRSRDSDRKKILERELRAEESKLSALKAEYKDGQPDRLGNEKNYAKYQARTENLKQSIERSEKNIEALRRELSN